MMLIALPLLVSLLAASSCLSSTFAFVVAAAARPSSSSALGMAQQQSATTTGVAAGARDAELFWETPLIRSGPLSSLTGKDVYLKLDALQNSGSFKDRGMAHLCHTLKTEQGTTKLISSSGGNAGLAVATVGGKLSMEVSVIVPQTTKELVIEKLRHLGAHVTVHGENWNAADELARQRAAEDPAAEYISPYDNPLLWTGHSTVIDEIRQEIGEKIGALVVCVGGGGLLCGVLEGLQRHTAMSKTPVIAAETTGAASFAQAWTSSNKEVVRLDSIDTIATSLGALEVTPVVLERSKQHEQGGGTVNECTCSDAEAVDACVRFAHDHRILVEPACGAALAVVYSQRLREKVLASIDGPLVIEVCGGSGVNLALLSKWEAEHAV